MLRMLAMCADEMRKSTHVIRNSYLVLFVQYKPTTYNRTLKKKKKKQNTKTLSVTILLRWEKPKLVSFFFPCVSSV